MTTFCSDILGAKTSERLHVNPKTYNVKYMITVRLEPENRELTLDRAATVTQLLHKLGRKPGRALVIRNGGLLTPDLNLKDGDHVIVRDVGSKG